MPRIPFARRLEKLSSGVLNSLSLQNHYIAAVRTSKGRLEALASRRLLAGRAA